RCGARVGESAGLRSSASDRRQPWLADRWYKRSPPRRRCSRRNLPESRHSTESKWPHALDLIQEAAAINCIVSPEYERDALGQIWARPAGGPPNGCDKGDQYGGNSRRSPCANTTPANTPFLASRAGKGRSIRFPGTPVATT